MTDSAYWLAFGDLHDDISRVEEIPELERAAGVIITGDITLNGGVRQAMRVLEPIARHVPVLLAQIGNMDQSEISDWLEKKGWNLHARAREIFPDVIALGLGCSNLTPFGTPSEYSEEQLAAWLEQALGEMRSLAASKKQHNPAATAPDLVLISHTPPHASLCDRLGSGVPVGSLAVRSFIETHQPALCLCGHIHESRAEDYIGKTHVINHGALNAGGYVLLRRQAKPEGPLLKAELKYF